LLYKYRLNPLLLSDIPPPEGVIIVVWYTENMSLVKRKKVYVYARVEMCVVLSPSLADKSLLLFQGSSFVHGVTKKPALLYMCQE
jgi:hypothetical protein